MRDVAVETLPIDRLGAVLPPDRVRAFEGVARQAREMLAGRVVWNINSTATGGGVAEMLQTLLAYARGAGIDARWLVLQGDAPFFTLTKRLHNVLHGEPGDGLGFGPNERQHYDEVTAANMAELRRRVSPSDVVLVHDPQPAGLVAGVQALGVPALWRCHIGRDTQNEYTASGWEFLRPYVEPADALIFSRASYRPSWVDPARARVVPPSVDPLAIKNQDIAAAEVVRTLLTVGLLAGPDRDAGAPVTFARPDGTTAAVRRHTGVLQSAPEPPPVGARLVVQISRWDRLKDMSGVMRGFVEHVPAADDVHLVLAGPAVAGVGDDPEGAQVLSECVAAWKELPEPDRRRVHLACIPMDDPDENAFVVNALQRYATIVVQKSLVEGFGLTVAEAMWKARPVVASAVGGIQDQIVSGHTGLLLDRPDDLAGFGRAVGLLLDDPAYAEQMGVAARRRVLEEFLGDRHLRQYAEVIGAVLGQAAP